MHSSYEKCHVCGQFLAVSVTPHVTATTGDGKKVVIHRVPCYRYSDMQLVDVNEIVPQRKTKLAWT